MLAFWFVIALMTLLALGFLLVPLIRKPDTSAVDPSSLNLALYKTQLSSLDEQFHRAEINLEDYQASHQELTSALLSDIPEQSKILQKESSPKLALGLMVIFPLIVVFLYLSWGNSHLLSQALAAKQQAELVQTEITKLGSLQNITKALQQKVNQNPQSAQGWYLLGRLYLSQQKLSLAVNAFAKANQLKPNDVNIMLQYAQSLFFLNHRRLNPATKKLIKRVLIQSPENINAINLLALNAFYQGQYQQAINYWQSLLEKLPPDSSDGKALSAMIAQAQQHKL